VLRLLKIEELLVRFGNAYGSEKERPEETNRTRWSSNRCGGSRVRLKWPTEKKGNPREASIGSGGDGKRDKVENDEKMKGSAKRIGDCRF